MAQDRWLAEMLLRALAIASCASASAAASAAPPAPVRLRATDPVPLLRF